MLKKVLVSVSLITLSSALSSCSLWNKWSYNKNDNIQQSSEKLDTDLQEKRFVNVVDVDDLPPAIRDEQTDETFKPIEYKSDIDTLKNESIKIPKNKKHGIIAVTPNNHEHLKGVSCIDVTYTNISNKVQTLGYIKAGSETSYSSAPYIPNETPKVKIKKAPIKKKAKPLTKVSTKKQVTNVNNKPVSVEPNTTNSNYINENNTAPVNSNNSVSENIPGLTTTNSNTSISPNLTPEVQPVQVNPEEHPIPANPVVNPPVSSVTPPPAIPSPQPAIPTGGFSDKNIQPNSNQVGNTVSVGRIATLDFNDSGVDISSANISILDQMVEDLKMNPNKNIKIQSYAFSHDGNANEARRNSLQRAIKVRKYLIDKDINASRISVNAIEDINNKLNKVEISFEEPKN